MQIEIARALGLPETSSAAELILYAGSLAGTLAGQAATITALQSRAQIPLTAELRAQIVDLRVWLEGVTDEVMGRRGELEAEIKGLEATGRELEAEALRLDGEILRDTQAAAQLQGVNTRRGKIIERLVELRKALDQVSPPSVRTVAQVLDAIIAHWSGQLPVIVQNQLGHFDLDAHRIAQVSKLFAAWSHLRGLRALSNEQGITLTPGKIQQVLAILARAERGQPMLLVNTN